MKQPSLLPAYKLPTSWEIGPAIHQNISFFPNARITNDNTTEYLHVSTKKALSSSKCVYCLCPPWQKRSVYHSSFTRFAWGTALHKLMIGVMQLMYSNFFLLNNFIGTSNICNKHAIVRYSSAMNFLYLMKWPSKMHF